jgi:predicted metal-binding membrane protein
MTNTPRPDRAFFGISALVFGASTAVTIFWCGSMSSMPGMEMPGGWTMSMAWMRMPGQTWLGAAAMFIGMWSVMMIAMMAPVLAPVLLRYYQAANNLELTRPQWLTARVAAGYFLVWTLTGTALYPLGILFATAAMRLPVVSTYVPLMTGLVIFAMGVLQFSAWKARQLQCCHTATRMNVAADARGAWRIGYALGLTCVRCCSGLTAILLVAGVMDLRAMASVTVAITLERHFPSSKKLTHLVGAIITAAGTWTFGRAIL